MTTNVDDEALPSIQLQQFRVESMRLGVPRDRVATVTAWTAPATLPFAPPSVLGVVSIEGRKLTVLDPLLLINRDAASPGERPLLAALSGEEQLALAVDARDDNFEISAADIKLNNGLSSLLAGFVEYNGSEVAIIDPDKLFAAVIEGRERRRRRS